MFPSYVAVELSRTTAIVMSKEHVAPDAFVREGFELGSRPMNVRRYVRAK
jgi:hypothetical protein